MNRLVTAAFVGLIAVVAIAYLGSSRAATANTDIQSITDMDDFRTVVLKSDKPVLVDVYATWCGPCKMLAPVIDALAEEYKGRVKFVKVDGDQSPEIMKEYAIEGFPTVIIFKNGEIAKKFLGVYPKDNYVKALDAALAEGSTASQPAQAKVMLP